LDPKFARAYYNRACLRYDSQDFDTAIVDFRKLIEMDAFMDSSHFRLWLIRARRGEEQAATTELKAYLASRTIGMPEDWNMKVGGFLAGQLDEPEFLGAGKSADPMTEAGQLCEAYFFAGSKRLFAGDKTTAADYFQKAIANQRKEYYEYASAVAELNSLKMKVKGSGQEK